MRIWKILFGMTAMLGLAASSYAQPPACCAAPGTGMGAYNVATEITLTAAVVEAKTMPPSGGRGMGGVHLVLDTPSGGVEVHVGPAWFVSSKNVTFTNGDTLTVVGSQVTMAGRKVVIAREVRKGEQVLTLRDTSGVPLWSGHHRTR
jgi:hypothetical protein